MKNPLIPMGAVTGDLTRAQISEIMHKYKDAGIEQYLIYPRDGCDVPYMSERWLELCRDFIEIGAELSMDIWLYDEFNWPSGTCAGKVMAENPDFCAKELIRTADGFDIIKKDDYADILNADATDAFIKNTHEVYYKHFGKYFGNVIKGIFSDEPSMAYFCNADGYPYSSGIEKDYLKKTGRDLYSDFINFHPDFDIEYGQILEDRFVKNFIEKIRLWCDEHNILMTGHLFAESVLSESVWSNGNTIRALSGFSLPGIDEIFTETSPKNAEWLTFGTAQKAISQNQNGGLAENFALGPTDIIPQKEIRMLWLEAMFGIDKYVLAVSAADARGNVKKNGWYNPTNYVNPWFAGFKLFGNCAKEAAVFAKKEAAYDVAVEIPYSRMQRLLRNDSGKTKRLNENTKTLLSGLTEKQIGWELICEGEKTNLPIIRFDENTDTSNVIRNYVGPVRICNKNGELADNVFIRRFKSGETVVIDLNDDFTQRELIYEKDGKIFPFTLPGMGKVILYNDIPPKPEINKTVLDLTDTVSFDISLDRPNTLRPNIKADAKEYAFIAECDIDAQRILRRSYMYDGSVYLDGKKLDFTDTTEYPVFGIAQLYLASAPLDLCKGSHVISVSESAVSEPYLPSVFILGNFSSRLKNGTDILGKLPDTVKCERLDSGKNEIIPQFAGEISYDTWIHIPDCGCLMLDSCGLYTKLFINGELCGERFDNSVFIIPERFKNKDCRIRIEQYTTIGPLFGRTDCIAKGDGAPWLPITDWFPGKYEKCGILSFTFAE